MDPIFELMNEGIAKSKQLLELAEALEWDDFITLNAERLALLRKINLESLELSEEDNVSVSELMGELISFNEQLEKICVNERTSMVSKLNEMRQGAQAKKAYS